MGDLVLKGATSGQITLSPTGTAGTNTLTLPAKTGNIITSADSGTVTQAMLGTNVVGNGPAFSAYPTSVQTAFSANTWTKILFGSTEFNTASDYSTVNSKYVPSINGYYQISIGFQVGTASFLSIAIYKNGSLFKQCTQVTASGAQVNGSSLLYLTTSDYIEVYGYSSTSQAPQASSTVTFFQGVLVRTA